MEVELKSHGDKKTSLGMRAKSVIYLCFPQLPPLLGFVVEGEKVRAALPLVSRVDFILQNDLVSVEDETQVLVMHFYLCGKTGVILENLP